MYYKRETSLTFIDIQIVHLTTQTFFSLFVWFMSENYLKMVWDICRYERR